MMTKNLSFDAKPKLLLGYAAHSSAANGTAVLTQGFKWGYLILTVGAVAATYTVKLQAGSASDGSDAVDIADATFSVVSGDANTFMVGEVDLEQVGRYVRIVHTSTGANTFGADLLLHGAYDSANAQTPEFVAVFSGGTGS